MSGARGLEVSLSASVGGVSLEVELQTGPGTVVLVGPNGAGKTSLLRQVLGVAPAARGRVVSDGEVLLDTAAGVDVPVERRRLGYVPQHYALFPHLTVRENVEFGAPSPARVVALLEELELAPLARRRPVGLSGGERQRVALARALAAEPRALLLDEPLAALDVRSRAQVRVFLAAYLEKLALPAIVVTHDAADARALGKRVAVLESGRITQIGTWEELTRAPASPFVAQLAASPVSSAPA
jgi:molybdate transport system ATP-binding protein